jgi:thioredoxin 1
MPAPSRRLSRTSAGNSNRQAQPIAEEHTVADIQAVTDADFAKTVLAADKPVVVDFWAEWCGPCRQVQPILNEIADEHGDKITVVKMNVDENPQTPATYRVTGIPTMNVYSGGEVVKSIVGARPKAALLDQLDEFLV